MWVAFRKTSEEIRSRRRRLARRKREVSTFSSHRTELRQTGAAITRRIFKGANSFQATATIRLFLGQLGDLLSFAVYCDFTGNRGNAP
jgi:hypothetical protein